MSGEKSFQDLLAAAPAAPDPDVIILVGSLARSKSPDSFVLQSNGSTLTLPVSGVKGHRELGDGSVAVEMRRGDLPDDGGESVQPFSLATGHQVPADILATMQAAISGGGGSTRPAADTALMAHPSGTLGDVGTVPSYDSSLMAHPSGTLGDVGTVPSYDSSLMAHPSGTLGDVGTVPSYDSSLMAHPSGTLGDVGTVPSYDSSLLAHPSGTLGDVGTVPSYDSSLAGHPPTASIPGYD